MATSNEITERRMVPRWRPFAEALNTGEVSPSTVASAPKIDVRPFLSEKEGAWLENKSLPFAVELVSASVVLGPSSVAGEAAEFVLEQGDRASATAKKLSRKVLGIPPETEPSTNANVTRDEIRKSLRVLKARRVSHSRSPFVWIDLARLYALMGQLIPANQAVRVALGLAPNERFVVRSATRFYLHSGQPDEALSLLRKCSRTTYDPWLLAAELAVSTVVGKTSRFAKTAAQILGSRDHHPFHLSELATSMGSLEMAAGSHRKAKRLFDAALDAPTDNSLAQIVWASAQTGLGDVNGKLLSAPLAYEARTFHEQNHRRWESLITYANEWAKDESFSARPRLMASGTASSLLNNPSLGESIATGGLEANPSHPGLINNLAFALSLQGRTNEAFQVLNQVDPSRCSINESICLQATIGLAFFRAKHPTEGTAHYQRAIELASKNGLDQLALRARLFFARERILTGDAEGVAAFFKAAEQVTKANQPQLVALVEIMATEVAKRERSLADSSKRE